MLDAFASVIEADAPRLVAEADAETALGITRLSGEIAKMGPFDLQSDGSELPVFFFTLKDSVTNYTVYDISDKMREYGWQLPAYSLPADMEQMDGLRVVIRNGMGHSFAFRYTMYRAQ